MADYRIRKYEDDDYEAARDIFASGMSEHFPGIFMHALKQPCSQLFLVCVLCALLLSSKSFLFPILAVTLLLAAGRQGVVYLSSKYIELSLNADLLDINKTYMESKGSCFWVAESNDIVVGMVAVMPSKKEAGTLELKRLSVRNNYRGLGIAKALCRTVSDFARLNGYQAVVLSTSVVQYEAQKLYEGVGYKKTKEYVFDSIPGKIMNFTIYVYRYDIATPN
ncbi:CMLO acetyltransferase, partial [Polyodon spathula]|nr:probable N-acetyltransferase camello [Polyodon spathula]MBN3271827.1 CMLO acetyltransferase [Polyodon spathula]